MRVQCRVCKYVFDDWLGVWERCEFAGWESKVKCPECIAAERPEVISISCYGTGRHEYDQKLRFPRAGDIGLIDNGYKCRVFANQPIRKFIRESCCGSIEVSVV